MRISDWSSDVCSSDLLRSRFTNALYGHGNVEAGIVMRPGFARQFIFRRFAAMRGRPFLQRGFGMFWRRMLAVNTIGPCCTDEGLGRFHASTEIQGDDQGFNYVSQHLVAVRPNGSASCRERGC